VRFDVHFLFGAGNESPHLSTFLPLSVNQLMNVTFVMKGGAVVKQDTVVQARVVKRAEE